mgnify:CR=1 FL=1
MIKDDYKVYGEKMEKTVAALKHEFTTIRAGRANPGVLDKITIEYFGSTMPINQIGSISVPEPRMLQIAPWDKSLIKPIEKAILTSRRRWQRRSGRWPCRSGCNRPSARP